MQKLLQMQSSDTPAEVRNAIVDLLDEGTSDVRIASAYVTVGGSKILFDCLSQFLSRARINRIPKTLITCLDFGITEPEALKQWSSMPNSTVRVAGAEFLARGSLMPINAFHPKVYAFGVRSAYTNILVGSANMTSRGFSINTEAVWLERNVPTERMDRFFLAAASGTTPLTNELVSAYRSLRNQRPPPPEVRLQAEPVPPPRAVSRVRLRTFREAVETGLLDPSRYNELSIQVEALQGGSGNQLELPREAHKFFGFNFADYDYPHKKTIWSTNFARGSARVDRPAPTGTEIIKWSE